MKRGVLPGKKGRPSKNAGSVPYKVCIRDPAGSNEIRIPTWIANSLGIKPKTRKPDGSITGTKLEWSYKNSEIDSLTIKAGGAGIKYSYQKRGSIYAVVPMGLARQYGFVGGTWVEFTADTESRTIKMTKMTPGKPPKRIKKKWVTASEAIREYKLQIKEADIGTEYQRSRADYLEGRLAGDPDDVSRPEYWFQALSKHMKNDRETINRQLTALFTNEWWGSIYFVFWAVDTYIGWTPAIKYYLCDVAIPNYRKNQLMNGDQEIAEMYMEVVNQTLLWYRKTYHVEGILKEYKKKRTMTYRLRDHPPQPQS